MAKENVVTPKGVLVYPHLNKPDTKFDKDGVWRATLRVPKSDAKELVESINNQISLNADNVKKERNKEARVAPTPYKDDGEGNYEFTFKLKASGVRQTGERWNQKPILYDAKGNLFNPKDIIWGGSEAKVAFQPSPYFVPSIGAGVSLRLKAVQIINLVTGGNDASNFGFKQEDGFETKEDVNAEVPLEETTAATADF